MHHALRLAPPLFADTQPAVCDLDDSAGRPLAAAAAEIARVAWLNGVVEGESTGYVKGARVGMLGGVIFGAITAVGVMKLLAAVLL